MILDYENAVFSSSKCIESFRVFNYLYEMILKSLILSPATKSNM